MALYIGDTLIAGNIDGQQLNNPFSLLDYKYSEYALENASWLLSNGQWNSRAVYQSVYDLLLQIYNGTVTKAGVSVKLSTETYTDTDFVLNTTDTTFRLPIKVLMAGSKRVAGNGMTLGLMGSDGVTATGFKGGLTNINNVSNAGTVLSAFTGGYGQGVGIQSGGSSVSPYNTTGMGITTDETKSGIETSANGLYLYFYVGETVQNANIIAAAGVLNDMTNIKNGVGYSQSGTSFISGLAMPSDRYEDLTIGASGATYTAPANGWFYAYGTSGYIYLRNYGNDGLTEIIGSMCQLGGGIVGICYVPVKKGDKVTLWWSGTTMNYFKFIYAEGEN